MPRKGTEATARSFDGLARLAREAGDGEVAEAQHVAGRARLVAAIAHERRKDKNRVVVLRTAYAVAAAVVLTLGGWGLQKWRTPSFRVEGAVAQGDGFVRAPAEGEATIRFADGSGVVLAPSSRVRMSKGAGRDARHIVLEDGHAKVRVARGATLAFAFDAGPFTVRATQGAMDVAWSGADEQLEVTSRDGTAIVEGGIAGAGLSVTDGGHLSAKVKAGELKITRADGAVTTAIAPNVAPSAPAPAEIELPADVPSAAPSATASVLPGSPTPPAPPTSRTPWSTLVGRGEYQTVLHEADATAGGVDAALAHRPLRDLAALADAGRYTSRTDLAQRALMAERTRFPGSKEAHTAAFLLGRLADDQEHAPAKAIPWYDRYLKEAPTGPFASDALGRKMVAVQSTKGPDAARPIAEIYARRFPHGAYSGVAEELMSR
jgi:ferric-dicitrate binding protein FerR (iron transport regulator)